MVVDGWYEPVAPPAAVDEVIACTWQARPTGRHLLTPDACVDIVVLEPGSGRAPSAVVCGPEQRSWTFELPPGTTSVGVRFRPGVAGLALDLDLGELGDARIPLAEAIGTAAQPLLDRLAGRPLEDRRRRLEAWCVDRWSALRPDPAAEAVLAWVSSVPHRPLDGLDRHLGVSSRTLQRLARRRFGYPPSTLARIVRFQRFCAAASTTASWAARGSLADLAAGAGYADHAHLARDCRAITGSTPTEFLADYFATFPDMSDPFKTVAPRSPTMAP